MRQSGAKAFNSLRDLCVTPTASTPAEEHLRCYIPEWPEVKGSNKLNYNWSKRRGKQHVVAEYNWFIYISKLKVKASSSSITHNTEAQPNYKSFEPASSASSEHLLLNSM